MTPTTTVYKLAEQGGREEKGGGRMKGERERGKERAWENQREGEIESASDSDRE